jgi:hypothetical protein
VPERFGVEVAAVVGVTVRPVFAVEELFAEAGDGAHAGPGSGIWLAGENEAVVEEDCLNGVHRNFIVRELGATIVSVACAAVVDEGATARAAALRISMDG